MENKEIIITIAIILVLAYFYWQKQQSTLNIQPVANNTEISQLKTQVSHYQTLYQKRVEKDLVNENLLNGQSLTEVIQQRDELKEHQPLLKQKITDLENSLLNLAKQKIKGKKDAKQLLNQLESNYQKKEQEWKKELVTIFQNYDQEKEKWNKETQEQLRKINLLFDEKAKDYEVIEFNGLYSLLSSIAERERERERESKKVNDEKEIKLDNSSSEPIKPIFSRYRKKKPWEK